MRPIFLKRFAITIGILFVLLCADKFIFKNYLTGLVSKATLVAARPVVSLSLGVRNFLVSRFSVNQLYKDNQKLQQQLNDAISENAQIAELTRENNLLKAQLGISPNQGGHLEPARIIGIARNSFLSEIVLNQGSRNNLAVGDTVIAAGNVVIGLISETTATTARVRLIDDPRSVIAVKFLNTKVLATAKGLTSGGLNIELVGINENVQEGDHLITSGYDKFPEGLVIGTVVSASAKNGNLYQSVSAKIAFDPSVSPDVFILKP